MATRFLLAWTRFCVFKKLTEIEAGPPKQHTAKHKQSILQSKVARSQNYNQHRMNKSSALNTQQSTYT